MSGNRKATIVKRIGGPGSRWAGDSFIERGLLPQTPSPVTLEKKKLGKREGRTEPKG